MIRVWIARFRWRLLATTRCATAQSPVQRGGYLVNGILTCGNCHTPGPGRRELTGEMHAGGVIEWDTPTFKVKGPNITPDRETGIGDWTDAQIKTRSRTASGRTAIRSRRSCRSPSTRSSRHATSMRWSPI